MIKYKNDFNKAFDKFIKHSQVYFIIIAVYSLEFSKPIIKDY